MLRRTCLIAVGAVLLLIGAVSSGGAAGQNPFAGTWTAKNVPGRNQNTPWKNGGTITIQDASEAQVMPFDAGNGHVTAYCGKNVTVQGYYLVAYAWGDGHQGTMGGCRSSATGGGGNGAVMFWNKQEAGLVEYASPTACSPTAGPEDCITGWWTPTSSQRADYFIAQADTEETTQTVDEPAPGKSAKLKPPPLPANGEIPITVDSTDEDLGGTAVLGEGDVDVLTTSIWITCWAQHVGEFEKKYLIRYCAALSGAVLKELGYTFAKGRAPAAPASGRRLAAGGCVTTRLAFRAKRAGKNSKKILSLLPGNRKLGANAVRYSCADENGGMKITVQTKAKGGLRKALGKKLGLRVYRSPTAPRRTGKLSFTFGW